VSEATALATLFRLWGGTAASGGRIEACAAAAAQGLRCLEGGGGIDELARINLPALLRLRQEGAPDFFVALAAVSGDEAVVLVGGAPRRVPVPVLKAQWAGEYAILWRGPPGAPRDLRRGSQGADVAWLTRLLEQVDGREARVRDDAVFDLALQRRVMMFQSAQGLGVDGVAGPRTQAWLSALTDRDAPRLAPVR
jgi:general secretion pathway protein A